MRTVSAEIEARVEEVKLTGNLYEATLGLRYGGKEYRVKLKKLVRRPGPITAKRIGDYILIEMRDARLLPLATCCIHIGHLEKGCTECPSLLLPPRN